MSSPSHRQPRRARPTGVRRRTTALLDSARPRAVVTGAAVLVLALLAGLAVLAVLPGHRTAPARPPLSPTAAHAIAQRHIIEQTVVPTKGNYATLLTPPGTDWWHLATSVAPSLFLYDVPAPAHATWYAITSGRSYATNSETLTEYQALNVAFPTEAAATNYAVTTLPVATSDHRAVLLRGRIVTFAPAWLDPTGEPYRKDAQTLARATAVHPTVGSWHINIGDNNTLLVHQNPQVEALTAITRDLGFTATTTWDGTAADPEGPWTGPLTGYNPKTLNTLHIGTAIASTVDSQCTGSTCEDTAAPLKELPYALYVQDARHGWGADRTYLPANPPPGALLIGGIDFGYAQGTINGSHEAPSPPVGVIKFAITPDQTMTLWTPLGKATALQPQDPQPEDLPGATPR